MDGAGTITGDMSKQRLTDSYREYTGSTSKSQLMKLKGLGDDDKALRLASREFAGVFIGQMMKIMYSTIEKSEIGHGGQGEEIFQDMLTSEFSRQAAYNEGYGISEMVYKSLRRREAAQAFGAAQQAPVTREEGS